LQSHFSYLELNQFEGSSSNQTLFYQSEPLQNGEVHANQNQGIVFEANLNMDQQNNNLQSGNYSSMSLYSF